MNWLTNFIRPRIQQLVEPKEVPDNLWQKCDSCEGMLFHRDLEENLNVCYHCGHHLRISVKKRCELMFDDGKYDTVPLPDVAHDPLKFKDRKKYSDRLRDAQNKTKLKDAITIAKGTMGGMPVVVAAFNFSFMGGSMGSAVGEALLKASDVAVKEKAALIAIPSSGGARMQEGMLSLMQMPRSIIAVEQVKEAGLPYIVLLTNPTTGGVSASFAMVGDIHIAEPGAMIGFAGRRVIEETVRETLPDDFQTAEYLLEHGIVDLVTPRQEQRETIIRILGMLFKKPMQAKSTDKKRGGSKTKGKSRTTANSTQESSGTAAAAKKKALIARAQQQVSAAQASVQALVASQQNTAKEKKAAAGR